MGFGERIFGDAVQEIVSVLTTTLTATVVLIDWGNRESHFCGRSDRWFSTSRVDPEAGPQADVRILSVRINEEWTLRVFKKGPFHHNADEIVAWAARQLAAHIIASEELEPDLPPGVPPTQGGGSSGPAELGIPVRWARKRQN